MKLILSSCDFINENSKKVILDNINGDIKKLKVLFVPPGKATKRDLISGKYLDRLIEDGFNKDNIYILDYDNVLLSINLNIDLLYIGGGNTFQLIDRIRKTGFDKYIINYIKNGVIYIGGSAGAHLVSKNIEHVLYFDDNISNVTNYNGLGLFDGILFCHYSKERKLFYKIKKSEDKYNIYTLTNDQSMIIVDDKITFY